jgi:hypothetical protein
MGRRYTASRRRRSASTSFLRLIKDVDGLPFVHHAAEKLAPKIDIISFKLWNTGHSLMPPLFRQSCLKFANSATK